MLAAMAAMQGAHNRQIDPEWRAQGHEYYRAIWVECAELLEHFGWKWWKRQQPDLGQVKLELVDIWHFGLSDLLRAGPLPANLAERLDVRPGAPASGEPASGEALRQAVEQLAGETLAAQRFSVAGFARVMEALPMPFDELFRLYVGKNVLNRFRQERGYRTGAYIKIWEGREDNAHLLDLLGDLDASDAQAMAAELHRRLAARYPGPAS